MFCYKCGKEIENDAKFCPFCGASEQIGGEAPQTPFMAQPVQKKNRKLPVVIGVAAAAVVIVAAAVFAAGNLFGGKADGKVFYVKDSEINAVLNVKASSPKEVQIEDVRNGSYSSYNLMRLSDDGSYLYYYSEISSDGETGTLCRIPTAKLKAKESANDKLVEEIDRKVNLYGGYEILSDNTVVYVRRSDELNWFDGKDSYELGVCDNNFYLTDDEDYAVYLEGDSLMAVKLAKNAKAVEIDDEIAYVETVAGKDFIVYAQSAGDYTYDYCVANVNGDTEVAAKDAYSIYAVDEENGCFYYTVDRTQEVSLYDYVDDSYAEDDADLKEPTYREYMSTVKATKAISESDREYYSDFDSFKSDCLYWYSEDYGAYQYYNYDDGNYYYYDEDENLWYSEPDWDAYNAAYSVYQGAASRISLRQELKDETVTTDYEELYYYNGKESAQVCGTVANVTSYDRSAVLYTKTSVDGAPEKKYSMDTFDSAYELREMINNDSGTNADGGYYFSDAGKAECEVTGLDSISGMELSKDKKTVVFSGDWSDSDSTYKLVAYSVASGKLSGELEVSDEANGTCSNYGSTFYYVEGMDGGYGTLYSFDGKKSYLMAEDFYGSGVFEAKDGTLCGYTDEMELSEYDNEGKDTRIAEDVRDFTYLGDGCYLLQEDDDLYYRNKKGEETRIARNISYYLSAGTDGHWIY